MGRIRVSSQSGGLRPNPPELGVLLHGARRGAFHLGAGRRAISRRQFGLFCCWIATGRSAKLPLGSDGRAYAVSKPRTALNVGVPRVLLLVSDRQALRGGL